MKKLIITLLCLLFAIMIYFTGKANGIMHTVNNAEIWQENGIYYLSIYDNVFWYE